MDKNSIDEISQDANNIFIHNLSQCMSEKRFLFREFPAMPFFVLEYLQKEHVAFFSSLLEKYDKAIHDAERLVYEYCDVIANFYEKILSVSDDYKINTLILASLPKIGWSYNRFYVGIEFAKIVAALKDESLIMFLEEFFVKNSGIAEFCSSYINKHDTVPMLITNALNSHKDRP
ncbi:hypothetical protein K8R78_06435 [bacterium]|nr:hypothetical protein [bacterium]